MVARRSKRTRRAFNLLEVTLSTVLIGVLLVGSMTTTGALIRRNGMRAQADVKTSLAHDLLAEMTQTFFMDPQATSATLGTEDNESTFSRAQFDDIDDYHDWSATPPQSKDGTVISGRDGYTRSVDVRYVSLLDPAVASPIASTLKRITITVTGPDGEIATVTSLRSLRGAHDTLPAVESTYVRAIQIRLDTDQSSEPLQSGTAILNQVVVESQE